jgi:hypothetical protein
MLPRSGLGSARFVLFASHSNPSECGLAWPAGLFLRDRMGMALRVAVLELMDRAAYFRDRAEQIRRLADAAWQPELKEALRRLANDYDEVAEDIETGAPTIRHSELLYR